MLVWSGFGFFIAVFIVLAYSVCKWVFDTFWQPGYYPSHSWTYGITFLLAGVLCAVFFWVLKKETTLQFSDQEVEGGAVRQPLSNHRFFFIPVYYWSFILLVAGLGFCVNELIK